MLNDIQNKKLSHFFNILDVDQNSYIEETDFMVHVDRIAELKGIDRNSSVYEQLRTEQMVWWTELAEMMDTNKDARITLEEHLSFWTAVNGMAAQEKTQDETPTLDQIDQSADQTFKVLDQQNGQKKVIFGINIIYGDIYMTAAMNFKRTVVTLMVAIVATTILMGGLVVFPTEAQGPDAAQVAGPAIKLRSRTFTPSAGLDTALQSGIRSQGNGRVHVMIQLAHLPDESERADLAAAGIQLLSYIPDNTWLASVTANQVQTQTISTNNSIHWMGAIQTTDKINPSIQANGVGGWATNSDSSVVLDVSFHDDVTTEEAKAVVAGHGGTIEMDSPDFHRIIARFSSADAVTALAAEDKVVWVDNGPTPRSVRNDDARNNTGVNTIQQQLPGLNGQGVVLGEWDGGAIDNHPDFTARLTVVEGGTADFHATHVAGTMAGDGRNSVNQGGTAFQWRGVATAAKIISYNFNGDTAAEHNGAINTYKIDLSQNSWGPTINQNEGNCNLYGDYDADSRAYDQIATGIYSKQILIVFAAGNARDTTAASGQGCKPNGVATNQYYTNIDSIAGTKNIISVGATNSNDDSMTTFSDWGPMDDGRIKPDVVAPGDQTGVGANEIYSTALNGQYNQSSGTSMAAPHVSGIAALLIQQYRTTYGGNALPSSIKTVLIHSAKDMTDGSTFYNNGPDFASGYGRVDAIEGVNVIRNKQVREGQITNSITDIYTFTVTAGLTQTWATLVWDDAPATAMANPTLVNNLDLELVEPNGTTIHLPWLLDAGNPANAAAKGVDNVNNVEQVYVQNPMAGVWTIRVKGTNVPQGPQRYSLVSLSTAGEQGKKVYLPIVLKN